VETHEGTGADSVQSVGVRSLWVRTRAVQVLNYIKNTNVTASHGAHTVNVFKKEPVARDKVSRILLSVEGVTKALGLKGPKTTFLDRIEMYDESHWDLDAVRSTETAIVDSLSIHFFLKREDFLSVYEELSAWAGENMALGNEVGATSHLMMVFDKSLSESLIPSDSGFLYNQGYIEHGYVDPGYVGTKTTMGI